MACPGEHGGMEKWSMRSIIIALIGAITSIVGAWITAQGQGRNAAKTRINELGISVGILNGPQKMCQAVWVARPRIPMAGRTA